MAPTHRSWRRQADSVGIHNASKMKHGNTGAQEYIARHGSHWTGKTKQATTSVSHVCPSRFERFAKPIGQRLRVTLGNNRGACMQKSNEPSLTDHCVSNPKRNKPPQTRDMSISWQRLTTTNHLQICRKRLRTTMEEMCCCSLYQITHTYRTMQTPRRVGHTEEEVGEECAHCVWTSFTCERDNVGKWWLRLHRPDPRAPRVCCSAALLLHRPTPVLDRHITSVYQSVTEPNIKPQKTNIQSESKQQHPWAIGQLPSHLQGGVFQHTTSTWRTAHCIQPKWLRAHWAHVSTRTSSNSSSSRSIPPFAKTVLMSATSSIILSTLSSSLLSLSVFPRLQPYTVEYWVSPALRVELQLASKDGRTYVASTSKRKSNFSSDSITFFGPFRWILESVSCPLGVLICSRFRLFVFIVAPSGRFFPRPLLAAACPTIPPFRQVCTSVAFWRVASLDEIASLSFWVLPTLRGLPFRQPMFVSCCLQRYTLGVRLVAVSFPFGFSSNGRASVHRLLCAFAPRLGYLNDLEHKVSNDVHRSPKLTLFPASGHPTHLRLFIFPRITVAPSAMVSSLPFSFFSVFTKPPVNHSCFNSWRPVFLPLCTISTFASIALPAALARSHDDSLVTRSRHVAAFHPISDFLRKSPSNLPYPHQAAIDDTVDLSDHIPRVLELHVLTPPPFSSPPRTQYLYCRLTSTFGGTHRAHPFLPWVNFAVWPFSQTTVTTGWWSHQVRKTMPTNQSAFKLHCPTHFAPPLPRKTLVNPAVTARPSAHRHTTEDAHTVQPQEHRQRGINMAASRLLWCQIYGPGTKPTWPTMGKQKKTNKTTMQRTFALLVVWMTKTSEKTMPWQEAKIQLKIAFDVEMQVFTFRSPHYVKSCWAHPEHTPTHTIHNTPQPHTHRSHAHTHAHATHRAHTTHNRHTQSHRHRDSTQTWLLCLLYWKRTASGLWSLSIHMWFRFFLRLPTRTPTQRETHRERDTDRERYRQSSTDRQTPRYTHTSTDMQHTPTVISRPKHTRTNTRTYTMGKQTSTIKDVMICGENENQTRQLSVGACEISVLIETSMRGPKFAL